MNMDILNFGTYDITHKGKKVFYDWKMYKEHEQMWLTYNGEITVLNLRKDKLDWNELCLLMCDMMDTLSKEKFKTFKEYFSSIEVSKLYKDYSEKNEEIQTALLWLKENVMSAEEIYKRISK